MSTSDALLIKDAAKLLQIGSKTLYDLLHKKGYIAAGTNFPREEMVKAGYFRTEPRSCTIKPAGASTGTSKPYYVTIVTDAGLEFLRPIVAEYKAATAPAPRAVTLSITLPDPAIAHALVRYAALVGKLTTRTLEEDDEFHRAADLLQKYLPACASVSVQRNTKNKKLLSNPKFQTVFRPEERPQAH